MLTPVPPSLVDLILAGARDIARVPTALDAELLLSTLIGGGYAAFDPDRGPALSSLVSLLRDAATGPVAALLTGEPTDEVPWGAALGTVRPTGAWAYGDRYGDQTGYVATFAYDDEALGGPEHALVLLVDHTVGLVTELVVIAPASAMLDQIRAADDEMTWHAPLDPSAVRAAADAYLRATDLADEPPAAESFADNRYLAGARVALLPTPSTVDSPEPDDALIREFLESPEARLSGLARATGDRREAMGYALGLCTGFAQARGGDPLRWSPRAVEAFLLEWVHGRAVLDPQDAAALPDVLGAWVSWAGRRVGLPEPAIAETLDRIDALRPEFARLVSTGEKQSAAVRATAQLVAEGVDLADPAAVEAWLAEYNAKH
jgi:hypothetical protein